MNDWDRRSGVYDPYSQGYDYPEYHQDIKTELVTGPTQTILSVTEAKNELKASTGVTTDDDLIESAIKCATGIIEEELGGISIYTQSWKQYQQGGCDVIELERYPIIGTPTVSYYSKFNTVTATNITATTHFRAVQNDLHHVDGYWDYGRAGDGYTIEYDSGAFTASNFTTSNDPKLHVFKKAIARTVAWLYEQREEGVTKVVEENWEVEYVKGDLPEGIRRLIMPYCRGGNLI